MYLKYLVSMIPPGEGKVKCIVFNLSAGTTWASASVRKQNSARKASGGTACSTYWKAWRAGVQFTRSLRLFRRGARKRPFFRARSKTQMYGRSLDFADQICTSAFVANPSGRNGFAAFPADDLSDFIDGNSRGHQGPNFPVDRNPRAQTIELHFFAAVQQLTQTRRGRLAGALITPDHV